MAATTDSTDNDDMSRDHRYYCVYIMGSLSGTLYIGFSGDLHKRIFQHKFHHFEGFTAKYEVTRLLYWESYDDVHKALARETQLKGWSRAKKIALIVRKNPHWVDLAAEWYPWMRADRRDLRSGAHFVRLTAPLSMIRN
jgi:putative endonuclease